MMQNNVKWRKIMRNDAKWGEMTKNEVKLKRHEMMWNNDYKSRKIVIKRVMRVIDNSKHKFYHSLGSAKFFQSKSETDTGCRLMKCLVSKKSKNANPKKICSHFYIKQLFSADAKISSWTSHCRRYIMKNSEIGLRHSLLCVINQEVHE